MTTSKEIVQRLSLFKVQGLFGVVVVMALLVLAHELQYVSRSSSPLSTCWGGFACGTSKKHRQAVANRTTSPDAPQRKWIIADVTSGKCTSSEQAPPGWNILLAGRTEKNITRLMLPSGLSGARAVKTSSGQVWRWTDAVIIAIARGADRVVEADCSVPLTEAVEVMQGQGHDQNYGLMYNDTLLFNPYAHFGAWALAPRAALHTEMWNNSRMYYVRDFSKVPIQHAVSDQSQDAVVALRTGGGRGNGGAGVRFDPSSPPVYVGQRSLSPVVSGCSMYHREAFWALMDPCLPSSPHCPVLRVLLQQRMLREMDAFSGYHQLGGSSRRGAVPRSSRSHPAKGDVSLMPLITFLDAWKCKDDFSFYHCLTSLLGLLRREGHLSQDESNRMKRFLPILKKLGIPEPRRVKSPWRGVRRVGEIRVKLGSVSTSLETGGAVREELLRTGLQRPVEHLCGSRLSGGHVLPMEQWKTPALSDVVLIVEFNANKFFWRNLALTETLYRPYFKHLVYCVTDVDELMAGDKAGLLQHVTLVEGLVSSWYFMYGCATVLMQMKLRGVRGYMQVGDDTLLNPWRLFNTSHDLLFLHRFGIRIPATTTIVKPYWRWWPSEMGRCPLLKVMSELEHISGLPREQLLRWAGASPDLPAGRRPQTFTEILQGDRVRAPTGRRRRHAVTNCSTLPGSEVWAKPTREQARRLLYNYYVANNMSGLFYGRTQDFYYVPQAMAHDYLAVSRLFMRNQVMVELGLHAINMLITGPERVAEVQGSNLWGDARRYPPLFFNASHFYLHPFKTIAYTFHFPDLKRFYCDVYLKEWADRLRAYETIDTKVSTELASRAL
ncbi:uncharacterized protein LOC143297648 [Babylonia areolata]|uniref:uncharacterized protein LOC143297648 n=1 Tax=Babylonia areolata TaxID=304850 RepID=UPI003FCFDDEE